MYEQSGKWNVKVSRERRGKIIRELFSNGCFCKLTDGLLEVVLGRGEGMCLACEIWRNIFVCFVLTVYRLLSLSFFKLDSEWASIMGASDPLRKFYKGSCIESVICLSCHSGKIIPYKFISDVLVKDHQAHCPRLVPLTFMG